MAAIGMVGDYQPQNRTHRDTDEALAQLGLHAEWVPTELVERAGESAIHPFDAVFIAPASPYRSMEGALLAIRYARERGVPLVGT